MDADTDPQADPGPGPGPGSGAVPLVRQTRRRTETRRRLLDAALEVFAEVGFGRARIEDVAARAGFTRGAFYSNFASLDDLFLALYADRAAQVVAAAEQGLREAAAGADPRLDVGAVVDRVLAALPADRQWFLVHGEFTAHALRHPQFGAALAEQRRDLRRALGPVLALVIRDRAPDAAALERLARSVLAVTDGMVAQVLLEPDDPTLGPLRRRLLLATLDVLDG